MNFHLLIVDDEAPIRKGLSRFINWDAIDCAIVDTASDGLEAMEKLEQHPIDIVITDIRMPEADGLKLACHVSRHYPDIQVIILTGYADFGYAQTAIQYNVSDFLLKPISKEQVIAAVQNAQKKIIASRQRQQIVQSDLAFLKEQILLELTDHAPDERLSRRLEEHQIDLNRYYVAAFQILPPGGELPLLRELLESQLTDALCYRYNNLLMSVFFLQDGREKRSERNPDEGISDETLALFQDISQMAKSMCRIELSIGLSAAHSGSAEYSLACSEAIHALTQNFYSLSGIAFYDKNIHSQPSCQMTAEEALSLNELETAIIGRDFAAALSVVNSIFIRMKSRFAKSADAKNMCLMIYYVGFRALLKSGKNEGLEALMERINHSTDIFELEEIVKTFLEYLKKELAGGSPSRIVRQAMAYIDSHLSESLSLDTIAGEIPASPSYLSRIFKKETGQSLTEYITLARIEKAKMLLSDRSSLNYEVAEQAGFHDPAYFSAIFKKYTGMSPKEYKNSLTRPSKGGL